ncbi:related to EDE1 protein involved in endocytosis [Sporisorium scitamineum]|uniref:Related to EDE1 protein involved in endocytosis n=1 Tax=Sporisorium scitamineum TaxID=49012 RepID=A0A0F7S248_9BASI|nr:hypothetical protein [Sporisorium scitamineum]CDU22478.1 related to EDE1 protein involved in endocytosis [Sporisorium scitamineum]
MQSPAPSGAGGAAPPIALSPVERSAFAHLFNLADPERTGIVTGDAAVSFFAKSKLPPATLGQIWAMADSANNGFLTPPSFSIALRLIGHAQRGEAITEASIKRPGPPPTMEGVNLPLTSQLTGSQSSGAAPTNMPGVIEIKPEDRARYTRIFANSGPVGGLIDGDRAKEIFVKSKLPFDKLGAIWNLADTQARGALDLTDFIIAMHFIQNTMNGTLNSIPAALPPGLYQQAKGPGGVGPRVIPGSPLAAQNTGGSASGFGSTAIPRQMTGSSFPAQSAFQSPRQAAPAAAPAAAWDVTPDEKARADQFFDGLDVSKQGRLDGAAVVPFFMQSKLTESVLAHVWDLSDVTQSGTLSKDEFAVAMHLINGQLAGKPLPQELPSSLVPPSMRSMDLPAAVNPQQSDTQKDLFSLMDDDPPAPTISASSAFITPSPAAPVVAAAQSTPFGAASPAPAPAPAPAAPQRSAPGPFDDDFFGGGETTGAPTAAQPNQPIAAALSPAATGGRSFGSAAAFRSPGVTSPTGAASSSASTSLLGTAAAAAGAAAGAAFGSGDQSAEYGNKSIQLQSTEKAVSDLQTQRGTLESSVATNASTIVELESRLATVRSQHETESKLVKDLEERQQKQNAELKTLREDVIREESELSALKAEKDELEQALMRDREDVRDMKKRMNDVQTETKSLKEQLEKLRKDARQQKGLVAISKKQLATAEGEQDKVASEIEAVQRGELGDKEAADHATGAAGVAPATRSAAAESVTSPAASVRSYNPFDRFGASAASGSQPGTPAAAHTPSVGTKLAAGAGAGAVLGGVVATATHHEDGSHAATESAQPQHEAFAQPHQSSEADPFGVQHADTQPQQGASTVGFDDAFAVPGEPAVASTATLGHAQAVSTDFDDNFGEDFGASATAVPASSAEPSSAAETAAAEPKAAGDHHTAELATAGGLGAGAGVLGASAIHAAEPSHGEETSKQVEPGSSVDGPFGGEDVAAGKARAYEPDADEDEDSSDDDDEGPEEVGGYKARGYDTPVGGAADRFPEVASAAEDVPTSTRAQPESEAEHTVPGGLGDVTTATAPASSAPVDPTAIGDIGGRTASATSIAPISRQDTISSDVPETATTEPAQAERAESSHLGAGTAAAGGVGVAALAAGAGALTLGERGHGDTTPSFASPANDNVPLSQLIGSQSSKLAPPSSADAESTTTAEPSASPTLSTKTRRAPPPAPVRSATTLSTSSSAVPAAGLTGLGAEPASSAFTTAAPATSGAAAPSSAATNPFGMNDFGAAPGSSSLGGQQHKVANDSGSGSNFDDFDSAFEDLSPSEAVPTSGATGAGTAAPSTGGAAAGFDDAFDNDFDFVPSFSAPGAGAGAADESASRGVPASSGGSNAFDGFDAAFDNGHAGASSSAAPTSSSTGVAAAIPALGAAAGLGAVAGSGSQGERGTASNTTSGFSFEDAFDPAGSSSASNAAAPAATTATPATPPTLNTTSASTSTPGVSSPSNVTSPTVPHGTYAPPPGPPPGFNAPPAVPSRSATRSGAGNAIGEAEDYTGALPDDAGPVKQLCGMGFTRAKVIQALEKSNYRTEKALERLLASA